MPAAQNVTTQDNVEDEQDQRINPAAQDRLGNEEEYHFFYNPFRKAIIINDTDFSSNALKLFFTRPFYAPLLFLNTSSDARDHAANERTYLSYLRLAVYLAVVSVAIFMNFHLKNQPTPIEERISHPLGVIFWLLALCCLAAGFANYVRTVAKYAKKAAVVQSGLKTQVVFGVVSTAIIAACGVFLAAEGQRAALNHRAANTTMANPSATHTPELGELGAQRTLQEQILNLLGEVGGQAVLS